jgi:STE24 endopeptidase
MSDITIDPEKQKLARQYARIRRRLMLVDLAIGAVYVFAWLLFGWSKQLAAWLEGFTTNQWLLVAGFGLVFGGIYLLINLPLTYYEGFILPHRFGLSTETFGGWIGDQVKGLAISGVFGLLLLEIVYVLLRAAPQTWWLWVAGILLLFTVILTNLAPVLLMPLFNKFIPLGEEYADLEARLLHLAERAHTRVRGVFKFDMSRRTTAANAGLTGIGNTRRIILADTMLDEYTPDEIETVLAHELGHQVHHDIPVGILVGSLLTLIGLYLAALFLNWGIGYFGFSGPADVAAMPLLVIAMGVYGLLTMPLENAYSRWRELRADQYALQMTGNGQAFASALVRLTDQNLSQAEPAWWEEMLLYSHPAPAKRIAAALAYPSGSVSGKASGGVGNDNP